MTDGFTQGDNNSSLNKDLPPTLAPPTNGTTNGTTNSVTTAPANTAPKKEETTWEQCGWEPRFGSLNDALDFDGHKDDHQTWIEANVDEKFYGGTLDSSMVGNYHDLG